MIEDGIRQSIVDELALIEKSEQVTIFYACESGSRAWGFESKDSDYDVRFLYLHPVDWYLTILDKPDVIERPMKGDLDVSGWDIRKALELFRKSNPPLLEWLQSPIVYRQNTAIMDQFRALLPEYYSPIACLHHYLHMAQGNFRKYLKDEEVWVKKYFYVLRPVLACRWIERDLGVVPIAFQKLVDGTVDDKGLKSAITDLMARKRQGVELDRGPRIPAISGFIDAELQRIESLNQVRPALTSDPRRLDELFREALKTAWG